VNYRDLERGSVVWRQEDVDALLASQGAAREAAPDARKRPRPVAVPVEHRGPQSQWRAALRAVHAALGRWRAANTAVLA